MTLFTKIKDVHINPIKGLVLTHMIRSSHNNIIFVPTHFHIEVIFSDLCEALLCNLKKYVHKVEPGIITTYIGSKARL